MSSSNLAQGYDISGLTAKGRHGHLQVGKIIFWVLRQRSAMIAPASRHISGSGVDAMEGGEPEKR